MLRFSCRYASRADAACAVIAVLRHAISLLQHAAAAMPPMCGQRYAKFDITPRRHAAAIFSAARFASKSVIEALFTDVFGVAAAAMMVRLRQLSAMMPSF